MKWECLALIKRMKEKDAVAILKVIDGQYVIGSETDIRLGTPLLLLLPNGLVVRTTDIVNWHCYPGNDLIVRTTNTEWTVLMRKHGSDPIPM